MRLRPILLLACLLALVPAARAQSWDAAPAMSQPRAGAAVAVLGGKIYVMGGYGPAGNVLGSAEVFDPATGRWEAIDELRDAVADAAAVAFNGRVLLIGGRESDGDVTDDVAEYVPGEDDWESFQHLEVARDGLGAVVLDGLVYAIGGATDGGSFLSLCEYYSPAQDDWYLSNTWQLDRGQASFGIAEVDGAAYFAGGFSSLGPLASFQRYAPSVGEVEDLPPMGTARGGLAFAADEAGRLYAVGGRNPANQVLASGERFDLAANAWAPLPDLATPREDAAAAVVGGTLYVLGGRDDYGYVLNTVEVLRVEGTDAEGPAGAAAFRLEPAYPNPFARQTTLAFHLAEPGPARLSVFDVRGREVAALVDAVLPAGPHTLTWDGTAAGRPLAGGVYVARLATDRGQAAARLTILR